VKFGKWRCTPLFLLWAEVRVILVVVNLLQHYKAVWSKVTHKEERQSKINNDHGIRTGNIQVCAAIHPSEWKYKAKKRDWKNGYRNKESKDKDKINMAVFEKI